MFKKNKSEVPTPVVAKTKSYDIGTIVGTAAAAALIGGAYWLFKGKSSKSSSDDVDIDDSDFDDEDYFFDDEVTEETADLADEDDLTHNESELESLRGQLDLMRKQQEQFLADQKALLDSSRRAAEEAKNTTPEPTGLTQDIYVPVEDLDSNTIQAFERLGCVSVVNGDAKNVRIRVPLSRIPEAMRVVVDLYARAETDNATNQLKADTETQVAEPTPEPEKPVPAELPNVMSALSSEKAAQKLMGKNVDLINAAEQLKAEAHDSAEQLKDDAEAQVAELNEKITEIVNTANVMANKYQKRQNRRHRNN